MAATNHYAPAQYAHDTTADMAKISRNNLNNNSFVKNPHSFSDGLPSREWAKSEHKISDKQRHFHQLKGDLAGLDGRSMRPRLPLGVPRLDSALAGGLALGRVHMLCASGSAGAYGAVTGFAICLLRQLMARPSSDHSGGCADGPIIWCPASSLSGSGMLYGAGLAALGLDPGRLLIVDAPNPNRRLEVLEDILRTDGLAAVVAEYDHLGKSSDYWMRLARRAQLAAEASGTTGFLLGCPVPASGFETIWNIVPAMDPLAQSQSVGGQSAGEQSVGGQVARPWHPAWAVDLVHARGGRPCQAHLSWNMRSNKLSAFADLAAGDMPETQMDFVTEEHQRHTIIPKPDQRLPGMMMPRHNPANRHRLAG